MTAPALMLAAYVQLFSDDRPAFRAAIGRGAEIVAALLAAAHVGKAASLPAMANQHGDGSQRPRPGGEGDEPERRSDIAIRDPPARIAVVCEVPAQRASAGGPVSLDRGGRLRRPPQAPALTAVLKHPANHSQLLIAHGALPPAAEDGPPSQHPATYLRPSSDTGLAVYRSANTCITRPRLTGYITAAPTAISSNRPLMIQRNPLTPRSRSFLIEHLLPRPCHIQDSDRAWRGDRSCSWDKGRKSFAAPLFDGDASGEALSRPVFRKRQGSTSAEYRSTRHGSAVSPSLRIL